MSIGGLGAFDFLQRRLTKLVEQPVACRCERFASGGIGVKSFGLVIQCQDAITAVLQHFPAVFVFQEMLNIAVFI